MNETMRRQLPNIAAKHDKGEGRPLEQLQKTKDILKGQESLRLRIFCTSNCMEPDRDLDAYGKTLLDGGLENVKEDFDARIQKKNDNLDDDAKKLAVIQDLASMRWGPTKVPLFNLLGLFTMISPENRLLYIAIAEYYIQQGVPVDGKDLSGTTALSHCFSTKPGFDLEYAQLLLQAGGDVNTRNRYGATVAHEIVQVYDRGNSEVVRKASEALEWFLGHGGNIDIADGDGMTPRYMVQRLSFAVPALKRIVDGEDKRRQSKLTTSCWCCGREETNILTCSKCKKAKYCNTQTRACQALDWPRHKAGCKR